MVVRKIFCCESVLQLGSVKVYFTPFMSERLWRIGKEGKNAETLQRFSSVHGDLASKTGCF